MSSPLWSLGGPYIFHLPWHLFDFVSAIDGPSPTLDKEAWKITYLHFLKVSYLISQNCKIETTKNWHSLANTLTFNDILEKRDCFYSSICFPLTVCVFSVWQRWNPGDVHCFHLEQINVLMFSDDVVSCIFWTNWLVSSAHREHDQIFRKPRQPTLSHPHDHSWPGERRQGLASGEEPRTRGSEGGRPRQQDGLRDLPHTTSGYQGGPSSFLFLSVFGHMHLMHDYSVGLESSCWPHPK